MSEEIRVTNEKTGGQKGQKAEQFSLLPWPALGEIAKVYAFGAEKYDRDNWRKGYDWHLSMDAIIRHLAAFWAGEDLDPESGLPHLAHAGFHVLTLLTFLSEDYEALDDRPETLKRRRDAEAAALAAMETVQKYSECLGLAPEQQVETADGGYRTTDGVGREIIVSSRIDYDQPLPYNQEFDTERGD